jgi:hypothetical protein
LSRLIVPGVSVADSTHNSLLLLFLPCFQGFVSKAVAPGARRLLFAQKKASCLVFVSAPAALKLNLVRPPSLFSIPEVVGLTKGACRRPSKSPWGSAANCCQRLACLSQICASRLACWLGCFFLTVDSFPDDTLQAELAHRLKNLLGWRLQERRESQWIFSRQTCCATNRGAVQSVHSPKFPGHGLAGRSSRNRPEGSETDCFEELKGRFPLRIQCTHFSIENGQFA